MGEVWAYVTALEIAHSHAPKHMKSMIQAIFPLMAGIGSTCAMGISSFAHDPYLVIFYSSLAGGMFLVTALFWIIFRKHDNTGVGSPLDNDEGVEPSPSSEADQGQSVVSGLDLGFKHDDVELGPLPRK